MRIVLAAVAVLCLGCFAPGAAVYAAVTADISQPPPAEPIYEVSPGERPGFLLSPGYWRWDGKRHVWEPGRWIKQREGFVWMPEQWEQRGDKWHLAQGHWVEDEAYEDAEDAEIAADAHASKKKPVAKKRRKKIDYNDTTKWPRVRHH